MTSLERLAAIGFGARLTKAQTAEDAAEIARLRRRVATLEGRLARVLTVVSPGPTSAPVRSRWHGRVWSRGRQG